MIASFSMIAILSSLVVSTAFAGTYTDVPEDSTYYSAVEALAGAEVIDTSKTAFNGTEELKRAEAAKMAVLAAGFDLEDPATPTFTDVAKGAWYYRYVETAVKHEVLDGYTSETGVKTFKPTGWLTKAQYAKILVNALQLPAYTPSTPTFSDVTGWAVEFVETAAHWGVVSVPADGKFNPSAHVTRYQTASMTYKAMNPVEVGGEEDDDTTGGDLEVSLSDESPEGDNIPGLVENAVVAKYDFTAGAEDVELTQLVITRGGLNDDGSVSNVALFDEDGNRLSNAKSFNSSDNQAIINLLSGGITIEAGKTTTISVVGQVGTQATFSGQTFYMSIEDADAVVSSAADVTGDFPVNADTFAIGSVNAGVLTVLSNGTPGDVEVGQTGVAITKFKLRNDSTSNQKIEFSGITLKEEGTVDEESELENFELFIDGESVATTETSNGKYISFVLDEPIELEEGKSAVAVVKADIVGGPTKTITFQVNSDLDVSAKDLKYGYGTQVTATDYNTNVGEVTINSGEVSIVGVNATATDILADKDNVLLGTIKVTVNAGQDLELQKVEVNIENTGTAVADVNDLIENVELYDGSSLYDLDEGASGDNVNYTNNDLSITLEDGETTEFQIRCDTQDVDLTDVKLVAKLATIGTATKATSDFYIEETVDDNAVTDITPSTLTFKALDGQTSGATASAITMSNTNAVIGTENIPALKFQIKAGLASDITLDELAVTGVVSGAGLFDSSYVSKVTLYKGDTVSEANALDSVSGSQISGEVATFEDLDLLIAKNTTQKFLVAVNLVDDEANATDTLAVTVDAAGDVDLKDEENDDVDCGGTFAVDSGRVITITDIGTLAEANVTTTSLGLNKDKNVIGNTTSDFVAAYEFTVGNEPVLLKDVTVANETATSDLNNLVSEVILIGDDKTTELAREVVADNTVEFTDINKVMSEGTYKVYVKVVTLKIGKNEVTSLDDDGYQLSLEVITAEGDSSGRTIAALDLPAAVTHGKSFYVVPVLGTISGATLPSTGLKNGAATTLAKVTVTPSATTNTDVDTGATLKTKVSTLTFTVKTMANLTAEAEGSFLLKKVGTSDTVAGVSSEADDNIDAAGETLTFTLTGMADTDNYILESAATYQIDASLDVTDTQLDAYFELELDASTAAAQVVVKSNDTDVDVDSDVNLVLSDTIELGETKFTGTGA
jgi:hypothetical protein